MPTDPILSVDFGTSYSLCGVIGQKGNVELVPTAGGKILLHSCISFFQNGSYVVGNPQLAQVTNEGILSFSNIKRYLISETHFDIFGKRYSAAQLATLIICSLKTSAEEYFGCAFKNAVVAKPTNFNLRQAKMLTEVFTQAGLNVCRMLDEGTAPCYLYPKAFTQQAALSSYVRFLVVDLGGGTLDLSVQDFEDGVYQTKAVLGNNRLGGIDYDLAVLALAERKMKERYPILANQNFEALLFEAERVKKALSDMQHVSFLIKDYDLNDGNLTDFTVEISRNEFRECTSALNERVSVYLLDVMRMATANEIPTQNDYNINAVMLTGQGAKIFTVRELINNMYPDIPVIDQFMENAVCLGNGSQAGVLQGIVKNELLLSVHNSIFMIKAINKGFRDKDTIRLVISMASTPALNTQFCNLINPNTTIPLKQHFNFQIEVSDPEQKELILPIYEADFQSGGIELLQELRASVNGGTNNMRLTLEIDANHQVSFYFRNIG
ncbi:Hsp70 family protein [Chitinophaga rhizophila]|uniref:Hsp70 family protein n=1 Tax=Chitinophaga rhizophila TaxID=2866212 RepID=A0ABS7G6Q2_9BACT|nr:Hsp70 family protein [Chitinophaga rhizophila]MBW8683071.1 Hsp70 family protein [Chitinophaga rhizophila]